MNAASSPERPKVVILACGNLSRGDDAVGPLLLERLQIWLEEQKQSSCFELVYDYQFQIEHALELEGRELALFIDASVTAQPPFSFYPIQASSDMAHTSHELTPQGVLGVWQKIQASPPPPSFVLCVRGESFELGEPVSDAVNTYLEKAFAFLQQLCLNPDLPHWQRVNCSETS